MKQKNRSGNKDFNPASAEARETFSSAESLDEYIRVSKPGTKIVLVALFVVLAGVISWGLIGKLPVTETVKGLVVDQSMAKAYYTNKEASKGSHASYVKTGDGKDVLYCFINASVYNLTQVRNFIKEVSIELPDHKRITGKITMQPLAPLTPPECREILFDNDWVTERCVTSDYSWQLIIEPDVDVTDYEFILADVTIVTEEIAPISFIVR